LNWLRADLDLWTKLARSDDMNNRDLLQKMLKHWQTDADLAAVREKEGLEMLPAAEQEAWHKLWVEVTVLLHKAGG
jgi:hypothetical protein